MDERQSLSSGTSSRICMPHLFQNYLHWGEYTGMLEQAKESARSTDSWTDKEDDKRRVVLVAFMAADNDAMWDKNNRDQSISVMSNAHLHHLCGSPVRRARTWHTSEVMCYIFHAAMCSLVLEDDSPAPCPLDGTEPTGDQLVLARPVPGSEMPYPEDDYLDSFVRPLYAFLQREVQGRATAWPSSTASCMTTSTNFFGCRSASR